MVGTELSEQQRDLITLLVFGEREKGPDGLCLCSRVTP